MSDRLTLAARLIEGVDGVELRSPGVGLWREAPRRGSLVSAGASLGRLEVLGVLHALVAPEGAHGVVVMLGGDASRTRRPIGYDELLLRLDPELAGVAKDAEAAPAVAGGGMIFRAAHSGRFYARPAADRDAFVKVGDVVTNGQPIALLEVMKTFNRIHYSGADARIRRVVAVDGADLEVGDPILELEAP